MKKRYMEIRKCIEKALERGKRDFIIYPFGFLGLEVKSILNEIYGIQEAFVIDSNLCRYNPAIKDVDFLKEIDCSKYVLFLASENPEIHEVLKKNATAYFEEDSILEFEKITKTPRLEVKKQKNKQNFTGGGGKKTKIGKYSYGPICVDHPYIESIGNFCSFAVGVAVAQNHEMKFLTTSPMIYFGKRYRGIDYKEYLKEPWYFDGVCPRDELIEPARRITIGNDVWLGRNVIITNYANIGNGVIAGAGAVITKDVPDYAVVVGVPARIIRYRYTPPQIAALNRIKWWDWTDDEIRERYDDLYLPVEEFIRKYDHCDTESSY